jgi:hypothetical protein
LRRPERQSTIIVLIRHLTISPRCWAVAGVWQDNWRMRKLFGPSP